MFTADVPRETSKRFARICVFVSRGTFLPMKVFSRAGNDESTANIKRYSEATCRIYADRRHLAALFRRMALEQYENVVVQRR